MSGLFETHAVLMRELGIRVLNVSAGGCLIESRGRIEVGTIGTLKVKLGTDECTDDIEVVRCEAVQGDETVYHVGVRLLRRSPSPRHARSIRQAVARHEREFERWKTPHRVM